MKNTEKGKTVLEQKKKSVPINDRSMIVNLSKLPKQQQDAACGHDFSNPTIRTTPVETLYKETSKYGTINVASLHPQVSNLHQQMIQNISKDKEM